MTSNEFFLVRFVRLLYAIALRVVTLTCSDSDCVRIPLIFHHNIPKHSKYGNAITTKISFFILARYSSEYSAYLKLKSLLAKTSRGHISQIIPSQYPSHPG